MAGSIKKGKVSVISGDCATVIPFGDGSVISVELKVPGRLTEELKINSVVIYAQFDDYTGIILEMF